MLRSFRFGEADRVLHLYTAERGRIGAIAKGVRKTKSRFGARLEPFSHVELMLHQGSGELHTVTGVSLVDAHRATREDPYRLSVGLVGAEAMLRLFVEEEPNERAFEALTRFLDAAGRDPAPARAARPRSIRSRSRSSSSCSGSPATCRTSRAASSAARSTALVGYLPARRRRRVPPLRARTRSSPLAGGLPRRSHALIWSAARRGARARARRARAARRARGRRRVVRVPRRLPPAHADRMRRELGDGYELDDDPARIDRDAVHAYLARSYWAEGRSRETQDALIDSAARVVGLYHDGEQVGFSRARSPTGTCSRTSRTSTSSRSIAVAASASSSCASRSTRARSRARSGTSTRATRTTSTASSASSSRASALLERERAR